MGDASAIYTALQAKRFLSSYAAVLSPQLIAAAQGKELGHRMRHPLLRLLPTETDEPSERQVSANTAGSLAGIQLLNEARLEPWLKRKVTLCCESDDLSSAASALGEIRALGDLARAGFIVRDKLPAPGARTCDFEIFRSRKDPAPRLTVEVTTPQMREEEARRLAAHRQPVPSTSRTGVSVRVHITYPTGKPEASKAENITLNTACKFAQRKGGMDQATAGLPHLLWCDLQDEDMFAIEDHDRPLVAWQEHVYSGGLWLAAFGRRGDPVIEGAAVQGFDKGRPARLTFEGMFAQTKKVSALVLSMPGRTVVFEHPTPYRRLPRWAYPSILSLPRLDYGGSWLAWPLGAPDLRTRVQRQRRENEAVVRALDGQRP